MKTEPIGLAVVGCGRWGVNHVRTAHQLFGNGLLMVSDANPAALEKVRAISSDIKFTTSISDVVDDGRIKAVIVATPAETHYDVAKVLIEKGKSVLVEKPITLRGSEAQKLIALAKDNDVRLMVGHVLLYHPAVLKMKQMIEDGRVGNLQYVYSNRLNLGTVRAEENILWSFAPHDISVIQYFTGSNPVSIHAEGGSFLRTGIEDTTMTYLTYPGNVHAHIFVSWLHPFKEQRMVVVGDRGMIVFEDSAPTDKLKFFPKGFRMNGKTLEKFDGDHEVVSFEQKQPLAEEQRHFVECVRTGKEPLTDGQHAFEVLQILEEAERSLKSMNPAGQKGYYVDEHAVVDSNVEIGEGTKIWHFSHIQSGAKIGRKCTIGQNVNIANGVTVGNFVKIQNNVSVYEGVTLEDYVFCGPSMVFTNILDPRSKYPQVGAQYYVKTLVKEGASLGANSTIVCGHTVGRFAFVGAGAVVTKNIPDFALVVGNPARIVGWVSEAGKKLVFDKEGIAHCDISGKTYKLEDGIVREL